MTGHEKERMLTLINGDTRVFPYLQHIEVFKRKAEICTWLIESKITGKNLMDWIKVNFDGSCFEMCRYVLAKVEKVPWNTRKIYAHDLVR